MNRLLYSIVFLSVFMTSSSAVEPDEFLEDIDLEKRARLISSEIRCLVCRNESIDESNAELARDLRLLIREHLLQGESNEEIFDFLKSRYGNFILLRPELAGSGAILWASVPIAFLIGLLFVFFYVQKNSMNTRNEDTNFDFDQKAQKFSKDEKTKLKKFFNR